MMKRYVDDAATGKGAEEGKVGLPFDITGRGTDFKLICRVEQKNGITDDSKDFTTTKADMGIRTFLPTIVKDDTPTHLDLSVGGSPKWARERIIFSGEVPNGGYFQIRDDISNYNEIAIITYGDRIGSDSYVTGWYTLIYFRHLGDYWKRGFEIDQFAEISWEAQGWRGFLRPGRASYEYRERQLYCPFRNDEVAHINILVR